MTLGQNIARLRAQKRLSQGDLAEALGVSRQSISKWETDASVPELEKLVKLSALFEVSLDELVKGERAESAEEKEETEQKSYVLIERQPITAQQVGGFVLLGISALIVILLLVLGAGAAGCIFGAPFFICGLICLFAKRRAGLWCAWAIYACVDLYLRYATGLTWNVVLQTFQWEASWNYMRLAIGWGQFLAVLAMVLFTLRAFRDYVPKRQVSEKCLALGWVGFFALRNIPGWILQYCIEIYGIQAVVDVYHSNGRSLLVSNTVSYICLALLCVLLIHTRIWLKSKKEKDR